MVARLSRVAGPVCRADIAWFRVNPTPVSPKPGLTGDPRGSANVGAGMVQNSGIDSPSGDPRYAKRLIAAALSMASKLLQIVATIAGSYISVAFCERNINTFCQLRLLFCLRMTQFGSRYDGQPWQ